jgi:hypothetical protein
MITIRVDGVRGCGLRCRSVWIVVLMFDGLSFITPSPLLDDNGRRFIPREEAYVNRVLSLLANTSK